MLLRTGCCVWQVTLITAIVLLGACSNRGLYETIQQTNRQECQKLPESQYEACMEAASKRYDEYKREREGENN